MQPLVIDSEIELRMLSLEHASELFALTDANRSYLRQWLPWLDSVRIPSDTEGFIAKSQFVYQENQAFTAGIWWRERLVGVIGHNRIDWDNRISHPGYWLGADAQGRGIMTRCVRGLVEHAFDALDLNRVEICTAIGNHRSEAIPRRLGFAHESVRRQGEWLYDRFVDLNVFAMLRHQWQLQSAIAQRQP
jgi:ribosomal-protein-serine acetyltransferase